MTYAIIAVGGALALLFDSKAVFSAAIMLAWFWDEAHP